MKLKITDNEALSVGRAAGLNLEKFKYFGFNFSGTKNDLEKIIRGGSILNTEKEAVFVKFRGKILQFSKNDGLVPGKFALPKNRILARENETALDDSRAENLNRAFEKSIVRNFASGILWTTADAQSKFEKAVAGNFFHHPAAGFLTKI